MRPCETSRGTERESKKRCGERNEIPAHSETDIFDCVGKEYERIMSKTRISSQAEKTDIPNHPKVVDEIRMVVDKEYVRPYDVRANCRVIVVIQRDLRLEKLKVHPPVRPEPPACLQICQLKTNYRGSNVGDTQKSVT